MPKIKLTKSAIDALKPTSRDEVYWDAGLPGFGVKVTPKATDTPWTGYPELTFDHSWAPATLRACAQPFAPPRTVPPGCAFGPRRGLVVRVLVLTRLRDLHA